MAVGLAVAANAQTLVEDDAGSEELGAREPAAAGPARPGQPWKAARVEDELGLFPHADLAAMEERLALLARETGFEVRVSAVECEGFDGFEALAEARFQKALSGLDHYRLALVLIGIDRRAGKGMVGTNLGAGMYQTMSREEAADLFLAEGEGFSWARIRSGVDRLASRLEEVHTILKAPPESLFNEPALAWYRRLGYSSHLLLLGGLLALVLGWMAWRRRHCPGCGKPLRVLVRLGGGRGLATRTAKCLECGFVTRRRYGNLGLLGTIRGKRPRSVGNEE